MRIRSPPGAGLSWAHFPSIADSLMTAAAEFDTETARMRDSGQPTVLVADDNRVVRDLVVFRLERSGYRVIAASDGAEALRIARDQLPDLAILDVMMPNLTGIEVTKHIRADEATHHIPVILLTARVQEVDITRGFDAGADDYIRKPFNPQEIQRRVQAMLGRRRV